MKKLMIILGCVAMAMCTQAATMKWSFSGVYGTDGNKAASSAGYMAYVFCSADSSGSLTVTSLEDALASISSKSGISGYLGSKGPTSGMIAAQTAGTVTMTPIPETDPVQYNTENVSLYAIILDKDAKNYLVLDEKSQALTANSTYTLSWANVNNTAADWKAVPEPTSGLLLLLGMAGLALKRKRA